jgi:hypothetical protein
MSNSLKVINYVALSAEGQPLANVQVAVLVGDINGASPVTSTTQPGSPLATLYADPQGSHEIANPATTDGLGNLCSTVDGVTNVGVWVNNTGYGSSNYFVLQVFGPGVSQQRLIPISIPSGGGGGS